MYYLVTAVVAADRHTAPSLPPVNKGAETCHRDASRGKKARTRAARKARHALRADAVPRAGAKMKRGDVAL